jgi:hypothetical protein
MRRYFTGQAGSPQQPSPQHEALEVAEATVARAATRTNSSANRVFFMILLLGASAPVVFGFSEVRIRIFLEVKKEKERHAVVASSQFRKVTFRRWRGGEAASEER